MFEKLNYNNKEDVFNKYVKLKGEYLHKQVYDVLIDKNSRSVNYEDLSSIIRYDKCLRDLLYIYLATFEELLRSEIFRRYDIQSRAKVYKRNSDVNDLVNDSFEKTSENETSNLYFCFRLDLGSTISFLEKKKMFDDDTIKDLRLIKDLRNNVMHHNLIVIGNSETWNDAVKSKHELENMIRMLCKYLPDDYRSGFKKKVNELICDVKDFKISME